MLSEDTFEDELDIESWAILKFYKTFRKGELHAWRATVLDIVQDRFPPLVTLVSDQMQNIDSNLLRRLIVKLSAAQTVQEAEQTFRTFVKDLP